MSTVELIYKIGANSSNFSRELGNAERNVQRFQRRAESDLRKVGTAFATMGGLAAGALVGIVKETIDAGSELSVLSDKVGLSVESLSALGWAAEQAGVEESKFRSGLARLNVTLNDMNRGVGEAANVAEKYGIALKTATGEMLPQERILSNLADAVANAANSYEEAEIAAAFFGTRAGSELLPLLRAGSDGINELTEEAREMGIVFSTDAADGARLFNDQVNLLKRQLGSFAVSLTADVLPVLNAYIGEINKSTDATEKHREEISKTSTALATILGSIELTRASIVVLAKGLASVFASLSAATVGVAKDLQSLGERSATLMLGIVTGDLAKITGAFAGYEQELNRSNAQFVEEQRIIWSSYGEDFRNVVDETEARMVELRKALYGQTPAPAIEPPDQPPPPDEPPEGDGAGDGDADGRGRGPRLVGIPAMDEAEQELQQLRAIIERELSASETPLQEFERRMDSVWRGLGEGLLNEEQFAAIRDNMIQSLDPYNYMATQAEKTNTKLSQTQWLEEMQRQAREVIAQVNGIDLATVAHLESLQELRDQGFISYSEYEMAVQQVVGAIEQAEEETSVLMETAQNAAGMFASSIIDFVVDPFNQSIEDMATNFIKQLTRMVLETAVQRAIILAFQASTGGGGTTATPVVGAATGGYIRGPGTATSDSIPAMLSDGEYVLSAKTTQKIGVGTLDAVNFGKAQGFAAGGLVGASSGGMVGGGGVEVIVVSNMAEAQQRYLDSRAGRRKIVQIQYEEGERARR